MNTPDWKQLLEDALNLPGKLSTAYSMFHRYSLANRLWAIAQLMKRGLPIAPIASYNRWKQLGRQVKRGEKALSLFVPRLYRKKDESGEATDSKDRLVGFMVKHHWFSLDQTEGEVCQNLDDSLIEVEAESVAYLCCTTLGLPGLEASRTYIQNCTADFWGCRPDLVSRYYEAIAGYGGS